MPSGSAHETQSALGLLVTSRVTDRRLAPSNASDCSRANNDQHITHDVTRLSSWHLDTFATSNCQELWISGVVQAAVTSGRSTR
jgi:hypothetical protein